MKYHFVYDEAYLALRDLRLSDEECKVVLATVIGNHNALFYGYKPERLVNEIKKLSSHMRFSREGEFMGFVDIDAENMHVPSVEHYTDYCDYAKNGGVYIKGIENMSLQLQTELSIKSENTTREFQLVATATTPGSVINSVIIPLLDNFDIVYKCKGKGITYRTTQDLIKTLEKTVRYRVGLTSGQHITGRFTDSNMCYGNSDVRTLYNSESRTDNKKPFKYIKVARSFADLDGENLTLLRHYNLAKELYKEE